MKGAAESALSQLPAPRRAAHKRGWQLTLVFASLWSTAVHGQPHTRPGPSEIGWYLAANAAVGAGLSIMGAAIHGKSWRRAAFQGGIGGGVHAAGKLLYVRESAVSAHVGNAISSLGSSLVVNVAAGHSSFAGANLPVGPFRLVFLDDSAGTRVRVRFNVADGAVGLHLLARKDLFVDTRESLQRGTLVLRTNAPLFVRGEGPAGGASTGSVAIVSNQSASPPATLRHELGHVQQRRFLQDVIGRPVELAIRRTVGAQNWWPSWLEVGVVPSLLLIGEKRLSPQRHGPLRRALEKEAGFLARCPIWSAHCS